MENAKPLTLSPRGLALLKSFEPGPDGKHFAAKPYRCPAGKLTIGWGHVVRPHESFICPIGEDLADQLLRQDVGTTEIFVSASTPGARLQHQFDALVILAYNIGIGAYDKSTLRRLINADDSMDAIAYQWRLWCNAGGRRCDGLVVRRACELMMFQGSDNAAIGAERARLTAQAAKGAL